MDTLITHGTLITASGARHANLLIRDERVAGITSDEPPADRVIDATGRLVLPGAIDVHTHLDMPLGRFVTADDFASGTVAALCGGTTTILDFAGQERGGSLHDALARWHEKADGRAAADYGAHVMLTDVDARAEREMDELAAGGVPSFKVFMAYPGRLMLDDRNIFRVLRRAHDSGALVMVHAENGLVIDELVSQALAEGRREPKMHALTRPPLTEGEAVQRAIALAELAGAPIYLVHLSTGEAMDAVERARGRGQAVYGETCPQYLLLADAEYERPACEAARYVMSPPLRPVVAQSRLWAGLAGGDLQVVATDHCPFQSGEKWPAADFSAIPNGAPGIETRVSLVYDAGVRTGRLSLARFVDVLCTAPAKLFGLYPRKGTLATGSDADVVIFDPDRQVTLSARTHRSRVDYSLYEGWTVTGAVDTVLLRGRVVVEAGAFVGRPGGGQFVSRAPLGASGT
jgi:dihydropyrimidinase